MAVSFFQQFMTPVLYHIPLIAIALVAPWLMYASWTPAWVNDRFTTLQNWFINQAVFQLLTPVSRPGQKWAALLMTLLVFIMTLNVLGLLPYTFTPTTQLSLNLGLAAPLWLATVIMGMRNDPTHAFAHFLPEGTPKLLIPVLVLIETISLFIRPLALGVRLTANLTAGHLLIQLIATAVIVLTPLHVTLGLLISFLLFFLTILEVAVAVIQAYVFVLLLTLYLQENI
uniref:ATP synthase subunit a n=1 Tax=Symphurus orientalis TaxID=665865 RepID=A0A0K0Q654_9PLEU|nr:ATP synthase subunit 6 [Symphurus orientalis]